MNGINSLDELCRAAGIERDYADIWGNRHEVSEASKRSLLAAMKFPVEDGANLGAVAMEREMRAWRQPLSRVQVVREGDEAARITINLPDMESESEFDWVFTPERGEAVRGSFRPHGLEALERIELQGVPYTRYGLPLPGQPGAGYHHFELRRRGDAAQHSLCLIVAPRTCYQPPALADQGADKSRVWGFAVQLYALRSRRNWGIGDFGDLRRMVEYGARHGASIIGVNPLHALFPHDPEHASPYSPSSREFLNVLYLDVEAIPEFSKCEPARQLVAAPRFRRKLKAVREADRVQYTGVAELKYSVLELLYRHFREHELDAGTGRGESFRAFQREHGEALYRQALFEALQEHFHRQDRTAWGWTAWPPPYQRPDSPEVAKFAEAKRHRVEFYQYLQWQAWEQLAGIGQRALELGLRVGLYPDLAVGVDRAGAEAWSCQELYALGASVGAPPDDYNLRGQDWGLPPLIPEALIHTGYGQFIATLRANMRHAGALRIDHVMGLMRLFWVPQDGLPVDGAYVHYVFDDLLGILALESQRNRCLVIGEDLGTVPDAVRAAMKPLGVLSYRLFYFEKEKSGEFKAPATYPEQALVAVTTHDLPTLAGFWQGQELLERTELGLFPSEETRDRQLLERMQDRARLLLALERENLLPEGVTVDPASCPEMTPALIQAVHHYLARAPSKIMLVQLEDVTGQRYQVNLPGTTTERPNWRHRLGVEMETLFKDERMHGIIAVLQRERGKRPAVPAGAKPRVSIPQATYRLQFNGDFTFSDAAALAPYLSRLGISHCYASPFLKARAGSRHGYDIVDHNALNPEIGTAEDFDRFVEELHAHRMAQILDIVPNHMGVGGDDNSWWLDVLENGQASEYAGFFDIDWRPTKAEMRGKVLLPVLGNYYGRALEAGELVLSFDDRAGSFSVRYHGHRFPIDPGAYPEILGHDLARLQGRLGAESPALREFESLITAFRNLPPRDERNPERLEERRRDKEIHKGYLAGLCGRDAGIRRFIDENVAMFNGAPGDPDSFKMLNHLLDSQAYRPAHWRVAADEINYRRFFDINDLAGLRMENPRVFALTHRLVFDLVAQNKIAGLRIDHPDGLYDPAQYYRGLQAGADAALSGGAATTVVAGEAAEAPRSFYVVAEKILAGHEHLPGDWPVFGTTGYDFANLVNGLFVYAPAEKSMDRIYRRFINRTIDFEELLYERKKLIMKVALASELNVLATQLNRLSESDWNTRDFTFTILRDALMETIAGFPVYRTYAVPGHVSAEDRRYVEWAIALAKKRNPATDIGVFDFLRGLLLLEGFEDGPPAYASAAVEFTLRFQQYTAPLMAKGMEDTAFYIYNRLISLNEVGGDPRRFGVSIAAFHHVNQERAHHWPHSMLCTSSHDTKRSEDARARVNVLSEMADEWRSHVGHWSRINRPKKRKLEDGLLAPGRNDEYLLYQTLVGAWPLGEMTEERLSAFSQRIEAYMLKAVREAKVHTSWIRPNQDYEKTVTDFVRALLSPARNNLFLQDFIPFQKRISWFGFFNSLSQALLKFMAPGVPDLYQGNELWDYSLVDPDNRRRVDYARRRAMLEEMGALDTAGTDELRARIHDMMLNLEDGRAKMYLTWRALTLRGRKPEAFRQGTYVPLAVHGPRADHLCAFARCHEGWAAVAVAPRWFSKLTDDVTRPPLGEPVWTENWIEMPFADDDGKYINVLTGERLQTVSMNGKACLPAAGMLADFSVALFEKRPT